mmetsp:Transcript_10253/g.24620  ORF Transcript_10253/g.24620 Transcript_10253/m.24620 type:complete len:397 (+) Transcript_10253:41-1231(+)
MLLFLALVGVAASTVCQDDDLITPLTEAPVGSILIQSSKSWSEKDGPAGSQSVLETEVNSTMFPWQVLQLIKGDRLLWDGFVPAPGAGEGNSSVAFFVCITMAVVLFLACAALFMDSYEPPRRRGPQLPGVPPASMRPTLEPTPTSAYAQRESVRQSTGLDLRAALQVPLAQETGLSLPIQARGGFTLTCCPDLVVPEDQESLLSMPGLQPGAVPDILDIVDPAGMPLLKMEVNRTSRATGRLTVPPRASAGVAQAKEPLLVLRNLRPEPRASLLTAPDGYADTSAMALAFVEGQGLEIARPDFSTFGFLQETEGGFILKSGKEQSVSMIFTGTSVFDGVTVTTGRKRVVATTNAEGVSFVHPQKKFYSIQVFEGVDVGVLLCCLVFIDGLQSNTF